MQDVETGILVVAKKRSHIYDMTCGVVNIDKIHIHLHVMLWTHQKAFQPQITDAKV